MSTDDKEITDKLNTAVANATPDVLAGILSRCEDRPGEVIQMIKPRTLTRKVQQILSAAAAVTAIAGGGMFGYNEYVKSNTVDSIVALDVNPSIEIKLNKSDRIVAIDTINNDASKVIGTSNYNGNLASEAMNKIIDSMVKQGYLSNEHNSVLITVENNDPQKRAQLEKALTNTINQALKLKAIDGAILGQNTANDADLTNLAHEHGISFGKAQLINSIIRLSPNYAFTDLTKLSITDLNLLITARNLKLSDTTTSGVTSDKAYIGYEKAQQIAFSQAGVNAQGVNKLDVDLDFEHGRMVYEVEFVANGQKYSYDIDATTGSILYSKSKPLNTNPAGTNPGLDDDDDDDDFDDVKDHNGVADRHDHDDKDDHDDDDHDDHDDQHGHNDAADGVRGGHGNNGDSDDD